MRILFKEYFYIPKNGKIRDKVMLVRVTMTVILMIACLAAMTMTAYAYFSYNVSTQSSVVTASRFDTTVTVQKAGLSESEVPQADGSFLLSKGIYTVTLAKAGSASTGFAVVSFQQAEGTTQFHTQQLGKDGELIRDELSFTVDLTDLPSDGALAMRILPHWGTSRYYGLNTESKYYLKDSPTLRLADLTPPPASTSSTAGSGAAATTMAAQTTSAASSTKVPASTASSPITRTLNDDGTYTVQKGDTLFLIADHFGVDLNELIALNEIPNPDLIHSDLILKMPSPTTGTTTSTVAASTAAQATVAQTTAAKSASTAVHSTAAASTASIG